MVNFSQVTVMELYLSFAANLDPHSLIMEKKWPNHFNKLLKLSHTG